MTISIRKFLLINLLLAITLTTTVTAIGNYYLDQKDIQSHLDTLLLLTTLSYETLLSDHIDKFPMKDIQESINSMHERVDRHYKKQHITKSQKDYATQFGFQIWSEDGKLLLSSPQSPKSRLSAVHEGFSDERVDGQFWRVFTSHNPKNKAHTIIGERYEARNELGHRIAKDDFYIMLLSFPLSGLLIWFIIGRSLRSLNRVASEISSRIPNYLDPVVSKGVPSEIKPVIEAVNKLLFRLQEAFDREKRFAADAAHELKTPLAALKTQAQVALRTDDPKQRNIALQNVIASVDRSSHIVQQLLTLSRLVPGVTPIDESACVNLSKLTAEIIAQLAPTALDKQIDIELIANENDGVIEGNMTALSILIRNLVDNAIRYTPNGGQVQVTISQQPDRVNLIVTDNGPGIPAELRARVFERFFRVLGNKSPGSGLGLAIVQQIAQLHHAKVELNTPEVGTGLEIKVIFPLTIANKNH